MRQMKRAAGKTAAVLLTAVLLTGISGNPMAEVSAKTTQQAPVKLTLNRKKLTLTAGTSKVLAVSKVKPAKAVKKVTWKSSNKKIATVSAKGKVKALKAGSVNITAVSKLNTNVKAVCKIKVVNSIKKGSTSEKVEKSCDVQGMGFRSRHFFKDAGIKGNYIAIKSQSEWENLMRVLKQNNSLCHTAMAELQRYETFDFTKKYLYIFEEAIRMRCRDIVVDRLETKLTSTDVLQGTIFVKARNRGHYRNGCYRQEIGMADPIYLFVEVNASDAEMIDTFQLEYEIIKE